MRKLGVAVLFLLFGSCKHSEVRKDSSAKEKKAADSKPKAAQSPVKPAVPTPLSAKCAPETLAGRYNVPREPDTGAAVAMLLNKGDVAFAERIANDDPHLLGMIMIPPKNSQAICLVWDMKEPKEVGDYITCRAIIKDAVTGKLIIDLVPGIYAVDVKGDSGGDPNKFKYFIDKDMDGDVCDAEFVEFETMVIPQAPSM